ncbi:MAG: hypothetical protein PHX43_06815 [Alphaproteobacteria bacterium]|nr:hypothetical protein [Alphaproteobacteria bacterium]
MIIVDIKSDNPSNKFAPCQNMAEAIASLIKDCGECTASGLKSKNFTEEEIKRHMPMANALVEAERMWMGF